MVGWIFTFSLLLPRKNILLFPFSHGKTLFLNLSPRNYKRWVIDSVKIIVFLKSLHFSLYSGITFKMVQVQLSNFFNFEKKTFFSRADVRK